LKVLNLVKQSVKLVQNMVSNTTQHPLTAPPPSHTLTVRTVRTVYILEFDFGKGRGWGGEPERRLEEQ
jgi:hypothetical protein